MPTPRHCPECHEPTTGYTVRHGVFYHFNVTGKMTAKDVSEWPDVEAWFAPCECPVQRYPEDVAEAFGLDDDALTDFPV